MSVKETGDRGIWQILNRKKRIAIIVISVVGIKFGLLLFFLSNN